MIQARVIRILGATRLILNAGSEAGVTENMRFQIIGPEVDEIVDPATGETLGHLTNTKATVVAKRVFEGFTIAGTEEYLEEIEEPPKDPWIGLLTGYRQRAKTARVPYRLDINQAEVTPLFNGDSAVHIGDEAIEIEDKQGET